MPESGEGGRIRDELRFGDLLALARGSWIRQMTSWVLEAGFADYRRSDALVMRCLARGPMAIGRLGGVLGVTRQAARKVADGLVQRGYAVERPGVDDARVVEIALTDRGENYAAAVIDAITDLNRSLAEDVSPQDMAAAVRVLRRIIDSEKEGNAPE